MDIETRWIVCFDIEGLPSESYGKLHKALTDLRIDGREVGWESTDECYLTGGPGELATPLCKEAVQAARIAYLDTLPDD